jgi:hypothetical protein
MPTISIPASKSLTLSNKIRNGNIKDQKIIVGSKEEYRYYSFLFFNTDIIPGDISLLSATLVLFKVGNPLCCPNQDLAIYSLAQEFSTSTTDANACHIESELEQVFSPFSFDVAVEVDITSLVKKWIYNKIINRGIMIKTMREKCQDKHILSYASFGSAYCKDKTLIPFIRVIYKQGPSWCCLPVPITYTATVIPSPHG